MAVATSQAAGRMRWRPVKQLVLDAVSSPLTRVMYARALDDFFLWWEEQGRPPFARAAVPAHRTWLKERSYRPSTINQRLAAVRKLAREAALNGLLEPGIAVGGELAHPRPGARSAESARPGDAER